MVTIYFLISLLLTFERISSYRLNSHPVFERREIFSSRLDTKLKNYIQQLSVDRNWQIFQEDAALLAEKASDTLEDAAIHLQRGIRSALGVVPDKQDKRGRIVVLGTGWGSHAFCKIINTEMYDVVCISPRPHFLFTPMLAACAVGTIEYHSIVEPIRSSNPEVKYIEGTAMDVDPARGIIKVKTLKDTDIEVSYDVLINGVGAEVGDFGLKGVRKYCHFIKEIEDARRLKFGILRNFELASLPDATDADIDRMLHFVIVGGGPTGVEFCGELSDFLREDAISLYPTLAKRARITLINAGNTVLQTFDSALQTAALNSLKVQGAEVILNARVTAVEENKIIVQSKINDGKAQEMDYGVCVWATGVAPRSFTKRVGEKLAGQQKDAVQRTGRLLVDNWLRVVQDGNRFGDEGRKPIFAIGDCAGKVVNTQHHQWQSSPTVHERLLDDWPGYTLPQTAQVAAQQGAYVARLLNRKYTVNDHGPPIVQSEKNTIADFLRSINKPEAPGFHFLNFGILASLGNNEAVAQVQLGDADLLKSAGSKAFLLWQSVYVVKQVSLRTRVLVLFDLLRCKLFGRDNTAV